MFSQACVNHSVHGGGSLTETPLPRETPPDRHPLDIDTPPYGKERAVRIILECILVHYSFCENEELFSRRYKFKQLYLCLFRCKYKSHGNCIFFVRTIILFLSFVIFTSAIPENGANPDDIAAAIETDILFWL